MICKLCDGPLWVEVECISVKSDPWLRNKASSRGVGAGSVLYLDLRIWDGIWKADIRLSMYLPKYMYVQLKNISNFSLLLAKILFHTLRWCSLLWFVVQCTFLALSCVGTVVCIRSQFPVFDYKLSHIFYFDRLNNLCFRRFKDVIQYHFSLFDNEK